MLGGLEDFLVDQEEVAEREREDLVVWLHQVSNNLSKGTQTIILQCNQVCEEEAVKIEVLCLAVNCLDRSCIVLYCQISPPFLYFILVTSGFWHPPP